MSNQPPSTSTLLPHDSGPPSANMSVPSQPPNGGQSGTFGIPGGGQSTGVPPQNLNNIVIEYLSKKGYSRTEAMLRMESNSIDREGRPIHHRAEDTGGEKYLTAFSTAIFKKTISALANISAKSGLLRDWIEQNLEIFKPELKRILWPLFVYSVLGLAADFYPKECERFYTTFKNIFTSEHEDEIRLLSAVRLPEHLQTNPTAQIYRSSKYRISLTSVAYYNLIQFLESREREGGAVILNVLQNYFNIVTVARNTADPHSLAYILQKAMQEQDMPAEDEGIPGHNPGSANTSENAPAVLPRLKLGRLPMEAELMTDVQGELEEEDTREPPQGRQQPLVDIFEKYIKQEPNDDAPSRTDVPLPPSVARDVAMEVQKVKENRDKFRIEGRTGGVNPGLSVVMYTLHNTYDSVTCLDFSDDYTLVAVGTDESYIRVWSLDGTALPSLMPTDESLPSSSRRLVGHSAPVYAVSFSPAATNSNPDPNAPTTSPRYLLSASADKSVRLWSVDAWACLVAYKGHDEPVWDVCWGPYGHYFLTGARDKTARLWSTDHIAFLRMFVGHDQDVDTVCFHPNSAYVFTGSSDKTVRMWSVSTGNAVRLFTGHTGNLTSLSCSPDGKTLASADESGAIILWDLESGRRLKRMRGHARGGIWSLSWSVESTVLVSGGADGTVRVWDVAVGNDTQTSLSAQHHLATKALGESGGTTGAATAAGAALTKTDGGGGSSSSGGLQTSSQAGTTTTAGTPAGGSGATTAGTAGAGSKKKGKEVVVTSDQISAFPTKKSPVYKVKFTRMNLVLAGGAYAP